MPGCVFRYCTNNSANTAKCKGITFHRFPRLGNKDREKWIKFVQSNRSEETWLPSDYSCVCSLHFREEDTYITQTGRRYLKESAVPCVNVIADPATRRHTSTKAVPLEASRPERRSRPGRPRTVRASDQLPERTDGARPEKIAKLLEAPTFYLTEAKFNHLKPVGNYALHEEIEIKEEIKEEIQEEDKDSDPDYAITAAAETSQAEEWMPVTCNSKSVAVDPLQEIPTQKSPKHPYTDNTPPPSKPIKKRILRKITKNRPLQHLCLERGKAGIMLQTITDYLQQLSRRDDDAFDCFGKYVATMLRSLPRADALALQPRIVTLLTSSVSARYCGDHVSQSDQTN